MAHLFSNNDQINLLLLGDFGKNFGNVNGLKGFVFRAGYLYVDSLVDTHGERGPDHLLALGRSAGDGDNFRSDLLLLHPDGLLHGDFVEGVHRVLRALGDDARLVWLDTNL